MTTIVGKEAAEKGTCSACLRVLDKDQLAEHCCGDVCKDAEECCRYFDEKLDDVSSWLRKLVHP